jgi:hypothetical protein
MKIKRVKRESTFSVTCTDEEKEEVSRRAAEKDMTISAYIRWLLANYPASERKRRKAKETEQDG